MAFHPLSRTLPSRRRCHGSDAAFVQPLMRAGYLHSTRKALYVHPLKNYRGRTIALPDEGYDFFGSLAFGRGEDAPLLVRDDGAAWNSTYVAKRFRRLCRKLRYSDSIVFHSLRHTYASLLLQAGASPIVVARQLGHVTMATVIKTYAHVTDDFIDIEFRIRFKPGFFSPPDLFSLGLSCPPPGLTQKWRYELRGHRGGYTGKPRLRPSLRAGNSILQGR